MSLTRNNSSVGGATRGEPSLHSVDGFKNIALIYRFLIPSVRKTDGQSTSCIIVVVVISSFTHRRHTFAEHAPSRAQSIKVQNPRQHIGNEIYQSLLSKQPQAPVRASKMLVVKDRQPGKSKHCKRGESRKVEHHLRVVQIQKDINQCTLAAVHPPRPLVSGRAASPSYCPPDNVVPLRQPSSSSTPARGS